LGEKLLEGNRNCAEPWNFGPDAEDNLTVVEILTRLKGYWPDLDWRQTNETQPHEANLLYLDNSKSKAKLGWKPVWNIEQCLSATAQWYKRHHGTGEIISRSQLVEYLRDSANSHTGTDGTVAFDAVHVEIVPFSTELETGTYPQAAHEARAA
jgi:CDP-glucose 4,6-dehydratase